MGRKSQNGYSACDSSVIAKYTIPGSKVTINLRKGDVSVVLLDLLGWYHKNIEPLRSSDTGGYNCRNVEGSGTLSNHASGTAADVRWNDHARGKRNQGFSAAEVDKINAKLREYAGVIRWGNNYSTVPDAMHFEINKPPAEVKKQADRIRVKNKPKPPKGSIVATQFNADDRAVIQQEAKEAVQELLAVTNWASGGGHRTLLADAFWNSGVPIKGGPANATTNPRVDLWDAFQQLFVMVTDLTEAVTTLQADNAALKASIDLLTGEPGVDPNVIVDALKFELDRREAARTGE